MKNNTNLDELNKKEIRLIHILECYPNSEIMSYLVKKHTKEIQSIDDTIEEEQNFIKYGAYSYQKPEARANIKSLKKNKKIKQNVLKELQKVFVLLSKINNWK